MRVKNNGSNNGAVVRLIDTNDQTTVGKSALKYTSGAFADENFDDTFFTVIDDVSHEYVLQFGDPSTTKGKIIFVGTSSLDGEELPFVHVNIEYVGQ